MADQDPDPNATDPDGPADRDRHQSAASADADRSQPDNGRILSLSDSVFAFAMTLMVLQFNTPDPDRVRSGALRGFIVEQWPSLISYGVTFLIVANFWVIHHRTFRYIRAHDTALVWINILFLLCISFLPFPTEVMGEYDRAPFAARREDASQS